MSKVMIGTGSAEIVEKKSRFIAYVFEIHSEVQANEYLEQIRKKHWDARHNCFAYVLGKNNETQRFSDDKEPQGTAGKPILDVLLGKDLRNTLIVVTRYFGGVLLGTGGLVRAYTAAPVAAIEAIANGECEGNILDVTDGRLMKFACEYKDIGKIESLIIANSIPTLSKEYGEKAGFVVAGSEEDADRFVKAAIDATAGAFSIDEEEPVTFCYKGSEAVIYNY